MPHDSASKPTVTPRALLGVALLCPLLAGACAHRDATPQFAELGAPMPDIDAPPPPSAFHRMSHLVSFSHAEPQRRLSLNSSIAAICADPGGRAVIDGDLPGLTARPEYDFFKHMSLKTLKSMSGGKMTDEDLAKVAADLAKLDDEPSLHAMR